jgi:hypothetical protein
MTDPSAARRRIAKILGQESVQFAVKECQSSGILRRLALVRTDVSEEIIASIIRVTKIGEIGTTLAVTSNSVLRCLETSNVPSSQILVTLMM